MSKLKILDLDSCMEEASYARDLGFNNRMEEAMKILEPCLGTSLYHTHLYGVFSGMNAIMTFESEHLKQAASALKISTEFCDELRKHGPVTDYNEMTQVEIHAEICYAESIMMQSMVSFFQNDNWVNFFKFGLMVRNLYNSYRRCYNILKNRNWGPKPSKMDEHFISGVHYGIGTFYLLTSLLPEKVLKVLRFLGFSGNLHLALSELEKAHFMTGSSRSPWSTFVLLAYHLAIHYLIDITECDTKYVESVLQPLLDNYPEGTFTLILQSRFEMVRGNFEKSIKYCEQTIAARPEWTQFHTPCYFSKFICHAFVLDFKAGRVAMEKIFDEGTWSRAGTGYGLALFLLLEKDNLSNKEKERVEKLMKKVPEWTRKIGGRTPPFEKYVASKAKKYMESKRILTPTIEVIYLWNGFSFAAKRTNLLGKYMDLIQKALVRVENEPNHKFYFEDRAVLHLLEASALRHLGKLKESESLLLQGMEIEKKIRRDSFVVPYTYYELGLCYKDGDRTEEAIDMLEKSRTKFSGFLLENRLKLRVASALREIGKGDRNSAEFIKPELDIMPELNTVTDMQIDDDDD